MAPAEDSAPPCEPSPRHLASKLLHAVYEDDFPRDEPTLRAFLFTKCRTLDEVKSLMGVYGDIVRGQNFVKKDLVSALEEHRLPSYIVGMYQQKKEPASRNFSWFKLNIERWLQL